MSAPSGRPRNPSTRRSRRTTSEHEAQAARAEVLDDAASGSTLVGLFDPATGNACCVCGCSDFDACMDIDRGPCSWAAPRLCDSHRARDLVWALWQMLVGRLGRRR